MDTTEEADTLINILASNKSKYTNADYSQALLAHYIQNRIGQPSLWTFLQIVEEKRLKSCPVSCDDTMAAKHIFGPDVVSLKVNTVRNGTEGVRVDIMQVPATIMDRYRKVVLAGNTMFANKIPFFI